MEIVKNILRSKKKVVMDFPQSGAVGPAYFGLGELSDILSFGFSFVEHEDHCVEYLLVSPGTAKKIIQGIGFFQLTVDTDYLGVLWTAQVCLTDKIDNDRIIFSNKDLSVVLDLNLNKMEE